MLNSLIQRWTQRIMDSRPPDVVIGEPQDPYLLRWWVWKRNKWLNLYLHRVLRSDDDRALHDHPWINMSYIVRGEYVEVTPYLRVRNSAGEVTQERFERTLRKQGTFKFRLPTALHRLELFPGPVRVKPGPTEFDYPEVTVPALPCTTLFLTGPRVRTWGFSCGVKGWVPWMQFTQKTPEGTFVAKGCGDIDPALLAPRSAKSGWWPKSPERAGEPSKGATPRDTAISASAVNRN